MENEIKEILDTSWMLPALGQGALGLECRSADIVALTAVRQLNDPASMQAVLAERAFLRGLGGGCLLPIAGLATIAESELTLYGAVLSPDGKQRLAAERRGPVMQAETIGADLAKELFARGAAKLLA